MAARAAAADEVLRAFDAEEAMRAELEALGEDVCSSEEERFAEDGAEGAARPAAGDAARAPRGARAWGWDRDPVEDVRRAWSRREARLRRNGASSLSPGDDKKAESARHQSTGTKEAPRGDGAPASSASSASSGDETSSEGETRETRAAFLRAYEARERARADARESRGPRRSAAAAIAAAADSARAAPDVSERCPEGHPIPAGTDDVDAAEPRLADRARAARAPPASAGDAAAREAAAAAAAAAAIQSRWRGVAVRRRLRRARDTARRAAAADASSSGDLASFGGVDAAVYTPPAGLDLDAEEAPLPLEATEPDRRRGGEVGARGGSAGRPPFRGPGPRSAAASATALEAAATEWGFRASGPAEEAFLRHRARLHVEARRRARREQLKDPLERVARFRAVAAATAPAPKKKG